MSNIIIDAIFLFAIYLHLQYYCNMNEFQSLCARYGVRATTVRRQLFELIQNTSPILATEFMEVARNKGFDTVSIYRTITLFNRLGVIYEFGSGRNRTIQLHQPSHGEHHHFIRCNKCDKVAQFEDVVIEKQLGEISKSKGFKTINSHYLEVIGTCTSCAQFSRSA